MTEHCANNGTSICQTMDATHLVLRYGHFQANSTLGFTYTGKQADLMFHTTSDPDAVVYTVRLCVTNLSNRKWYVLTYENPYDSTTTSVVKALEPYVKDIELYAVKEPDFLKRDDDELIIFIRIDYDCVTLGIEEIDDEQQVRLWRCLELLQREPEFADMTVNGVPAHRAVVATASDLLDHSIAALPYIGLTHDKLQSKIQAHSTENQLKYGSEASVLKDQSIVTGNDATNAKLYDCEEVLPLNTGGLKQESETKTIEDLGAASTSTRSETESKVDILKKKFEENLPVFAELSCTPRVDVMAKLIEDLKDAMQTVKEINHSKELELLDLKRPYPENYSFAMDRLTNELHLTAFLRYVYIGAIDNNPIDSKITGNTLMTMIDDLLQAAICYKLPNLVHNLQKLMRKSLIHENTVQDVLQLAKKFDLDDVKLGAIDFLRGKNVALFDNPSLYEIVISKPDILTNNKQQANTTHCKKHAIFTFNRPRGADSQTSESFYIAGIAVCVKTWYTVGNRYTLLLPASTPLTVSLHAVDSACPRISMSLNVSLRLPNGVYLVRKVDGSLPLIEIQSFTTHADLQSVYSGGIATFEVVLKLK